MVKVVQMQYKNLEYYGEDIDIHAMGLKRRRKKIRKHQPKLELLKWQEKSLVKK